MDRQLIEEKLESLHRYVKRVETKCPETAEILATDWDLQDIIALNLSRAVHLCVDIGAHILSTTEAKAPATMAETFDILATQKILTLDLASRLKKAVGFRNIAVHDYQTVNWEIVHALCNHRLVDIKEFAQSVTRAMAA